MFRNFMIRAIRRDWVFLKEDALERSERGVAEIRKERHAQYGGGSIKKNVFHDQVVEILEERKMQRQRRRHMPTAISGQAGSVLLLQNRVATTINT